MRKFRYLIPALALAITAMLPTTVAAACDPGRSNTTTSTSVLQSMTADSGVVLEKITADVDIQRPFLESGGNVNMFLQLAGASGGEVHIGINYRQGQPTRLFTYFSDRNDNVVEGYHYYSIASGSTHAVLSIEFAQTSSTQWRYRVINSGTVVRTWYYDQSEYFTPVSGRKFATSNNLGNGFPGVTGNVAYFRNPTYQSNFGTGTWGGGTSNLSLGNAVIGYNSGGFWVRDADC